MQAGVPEKLGGGRATPARRPDFYPTQVLWSNTCERAQSPVRALRNLIVKNLFISQINFAHNTSS